ncbi:MAG: NAD(P)-dependent oxidoreductase [Verrucomicrobiota bacterium]
MKIFITGGSGFIGSHVVKQALAAGHIVTALRYSSDRPKIPLPTQPAWVDGALSDDWRAALKGCDVLIHLAAAGVSMQNLEWEKLFQVNVEQSLNLWLQAANAGVKRFIITGSCFEYGSTAAQLEFIPADAPLLPTGPYHASKAAATMAALGLAVDRGLELVLLRPFHVYGEGEAIPRFWPALRKAALAGEDFPMTLGEQVRVFTPVEQVAAAFVAAVTRTDVQPGNPLIENLACGQAQSLRDFAEHWWRVWNAKGRLIPGAVPYRANEIMRYVPAVTTPKNGPPSAA